MEILIVPATWGCCRIKQIITMKTPSRAPGTIRECKNEQLFLICLGKVGLQLVVGKGPANPRPQAPPARGPALWVSHSGGLSLSRVTISPGTQPHSCWGTWDARALPTDPASGPVSRGRSQGQLCLSLRFPPYLDVVVAEKPGHGPGAIDEPDVLARAPEGGGQPGVEDIVCGCRHRGCVSVSPPRTEGGPEVGFGVTHCRPCWSSRWRVPISQLSRCQR